MAEEIGVDYLVFANIQYHNWALLNREELLPTREQIAHAESAVQGLRAAWSTADYLVLNLTSTAAPSSGGTARCLAAAAGTSPRRKQGAGGHSRL